MLMTVSMHYSTRPLPQRNLTSSSRYWRSHVLPKLAVPTLFWNVFLCFQWNSSSFTVTFELLYNWTGSSVCCTQRTPVDCISPVFPSAAFFRGFCGCLFLSSIKWSMEFQSHGRAYVIPENEEISHASQTVHNDNGNEGERAVSKLQRRHSDIKVYKEICDFYARL